MQAKTPVLHGHAIEITVRVKRVLAPNPGMMTGAGTNTYLVGGRDVAVVDVGSADEGHLDAIEAATQGRIRWILVTHSHPDHAPGAFELAERTGAVVLGCGARGAFPGTRFEPHQRLRDGDVVRGEDWSIAVLHTPGHARDHLCFLLHPEGILFSGDHVMGGSTVVIAPPDGDMAAYLASLERLLTVPVRSIAPGHGDVITTPQAELRRLLAHRRAREASILRALMERGGQRIPELVANLYADTPLTLHEWAAHSVYAHLLKLRSEGRVSGRDRRSVWRVAG